MMSPFPLIVTGGGFLASSSGLKQPDHHLPRQLHPAGRQRIAIHRTLSCSAMTMQIVSELNPREA
jgi:ABC-type polar amino acid transport system ATPase subunit